MAAKGRREKASGSIYKKGQYYVAQVQDGYRDNGMPKYRQAQRKTHADAVKALNELMVKVTTGLSTPDGRAPTVVDWMERWLDEHVRPTLAPKSYDFYRLHTDRIRPYLAKTDLRKLKALDVSRLFGKLRESGASENTVDAVRRTLRAAYGVAVKMGLCSENPVVKTFAPKVERKERAHLSPDEARRLVDALHGSPVEGLVLFCLATGLRIGEATGLSWSDIDLNPDREQFTVRNQLQRINGKLVLRALKTEKSRRVLPLIGDSLQAIRSEQARRSIEGHENPLDLVFLNPYGRPFDQKYANDCFKEVLKVAEIGSMSMHALRHSAATYMLMTGLNMHQVSRYLGHSQIALTSNLYGHVLDESTRQAAKSIQDLYRSNSSGH